MASNISKIEKEFIFTFLIKNKIKIEIKCGENTTEGIFLEQSAKEIKVELTFVLEEMLDFNASVKIFFYFQNTHHVFSSLILRRQNNIIIIKNPESIARNLLRKYERIRIDGKYNIYFEIEGKILELDYPKCNVHYNPLHPPISADFSDVKIEHILTRFKEKMNTLVSVNKIIMMRNYVPKTFFEELVLNTGKILVVPNSHHDIPAKQPYSNFDILLRTDWVDYEIKTNHTNPGMVNKVLSDYLMLLSRNNILSYVIMPVIYRYYVVALIFLINNHQRNTKMDQKILDYSYQFSKIMTYTLKINGYFNNEIGPKDSYTIPIFDLSPGGVGFYVDNDSMEEKLILDQNIRMSLVIENRQIRVLAKLVRKFQNLSRYFYGFVFLEIKTDDTAHLNRLLYQKS